MYGNKLKELRENNHIKQIDLCKILKITNNTYSNYETEYQIIPIKHLNTICNFYNVSLDYIFSFTDIKQYTDNKKEIDKKFAGERLKKFRKKYQIKQQELSNLLNIGYGTISGYETCRYLIATPFLYTICKKYNISADYLLGKIDNPKTF